MRGRWIPVGVAAVLTAGAVMAQNLPNNAEMALKLSDQNLINTKALKNYSWTTRLEQFKKGESKAVRLLKVRFDATGEVQLTPMGGTPEKKKRGIRGMMQKKKKKEAKEFIEQVAEMIQAYTRPSSGNFLDFLNKASFTAGKKPMKNTLQIQGGNLVQPGDSVTMWYDAATNHPRKIQFRNKLDEKILDATVEYSDLKDGTFYASRTVVKVPEEEIQVVAESFDHIKQEN